MPKVSVCVATHDPKFLKETIDSVLAQTFTDFELVLVPNNGLALTEPTDSRIRIVPFPVSGATNIGQIKNFAFTQGKGEVLVELDHDDILAPNCLEEVVKKYEEGFDFIYSQCAQFEGEFSNPKPRKPFTPECGWTYKTLPNGLIVQSLFDIHPISLARIYYAPDHVRAISKKLYQTIGGHDHKLEICDDADLIQRAYIAGGKFGRIDQCLYFYRVHENNSWPKRQQMINDKTEELRDRNIEAMMLEWSKRNNLKAIDLCGGFGKPAGYTSIDIKGGDITADLNEDWPLADGSVGVIRAVDSLEHLKDKGHTMREIWRVLAHGGMLLSCTPSFPGAGSVMDETHVSMWNEQSFWYYVNKEYAKYISNTKYRFQTDILRTVFPSDFHKQHNISYVVADLIALKEGGFRIPGFQLI